MVAASVACNPPIQFNEPPSVTITSPVDGERIAAGAAFTVTLEVEDVDGDVLHVEVFSDTAGLLAGSPVAPEETTVALEVDYLDPGEHLLSAVVDDGARTASAEISLTVNGAPTAPQVSLTPVQATTGDDLVATVETPATDAEGDSLGYRFVWTRNGKEVRTIQGDGATVSASETAAGQLWEVTLTAFELDSGLESPPDREVVEVVNSAPEAPAAVVLLPSRPHVLSDLRCSAADPGEDVDGDVLTARYQWTRNGSSTGQEDAIVGSSLTNPGDVWSCEVSWDDGQATSPLTASPPVTVAPSVVSIDDGTLGALRFTGDDDGMLFGASAAAHGLDDRDGPDLIVGIPFPITADRGMVVGFTGGASLTSETVAGRDVALIGEDNSFLGASIAVIADAVGDGAPDLLVRAGGSKTTAPGVYVIPGGHADSAAVPAPFGGVYIEGPSDHREFGIGLAGAELDGKGMGASVLVGAPFGPGPTGRVWLFDPAALGGADLTADLDATTLIESSADSFGTHLRSGDANGDGLDDVAIAAPMHPTDTVAVFLADTLPSAVAPGDADLTIDDSEGVEPAGWMELADLDNDGYHDLLLGDPGGRGTLVVIPGQASLPARLSTDAAVLRIGGGGGRFGQRFLVAPDLGSDGIPDLGVAAPDATNPSGGNAQGAVYWFDGADLTPGEHGVAGAALTLYGAADDDGASLGNNVGDLDGDGVIDLMITSPEADVGRVDAGAVDLLLSGR